jgi:energy-converting hydrogenase Eha subunit C
MLAPYQLASGGTVSSYSDVQKAVRVEKFRIWFAWVSGGIIMLIIANATKDIAILGIITEVLFFVGGILFTITAVRMTNALNSKAEAARREVLGEL